MNRAEERSTAADATDLLVHIDAGSATPLYRQVYDGLRTAILDGRVTEGARLPSTRELATRLGLGRNTITAAFEQLRAEGYVTGRSGGGTRVREVLPDRLVSRRAVSRPSASRVPPPSPRVTLSRRGTAMVQAARAFPAVSRPVRAFQLGVPALDAFPVRQWTRLVNRRWRQPSLGLAEAVGYAPLRRAVASYLASARAVRCSWEQVVIVNGSQHALHLAAQLLLDPGEEVWMEDPGYPGARSAFRAAGATVVPVPVDDDGLRVDEGSRRAPRARLAYVTPSHQFPLGSTMSVGRRLELLAWARQTGAWVLEDDYDSEFRYAGRPLPALQGLDGDGRVLYVGTFSKTLFPALRLGYIVVPEPLVDPMAALRSLGDRHSPTMEQAVVADFLVEGHFGSHLRRMRTLYAERQEALLDAAARELRGILDVQVDDAGLHLVGWLPPGSDDEATAARLAARGITVDALSSYAIDVPARPVLLLGYTAVSRAEIRYAVTRMADVLTGA